MKSTFKSLDAYKNVNYKDAINIYGGISPYGVAAKVIYSGVKHYKSILKGISMGYK